VIKHVTCIGCGVLKKYEDAVGWTRGQRRVCGAVGRRDIYLYGMEAFALGMVVHYITSRSCTTTLSEADCGLGAGVGLLT
jgi:hypothetical protein